MTQPNNPMNNTLPEGVKERFYAHLQETGHDDTHDTWFRFLASELARQREELERQHALKIAFVESGIEQRAVELAYKKLEERDKKTRTELLAWVEKEFESLHGSVDGVSDGERFEKYRNAVYAIKANIITKLKQKREGGVKFLLTTLQTEVEKLRTNIESLKELPKEKSVTDTLVVLAIQNNRTIDDILAIINKL